MQTDIEGKVALRVTPREWRWVSLISIGVLFLTLIPYLAGYYFTPSGKTFSGVSAISFFDIHSYLAWIEQAKEGDFFFTDLFTTDAQPRVFFHPIFYLLGVIAHFASLSPVAIYHVGRMVIGFIFLLTAYYFIAFFFGKTLHRKICFLLLILSSGIGPLNDALSLSYMPEINVFVSLFVSVLNIASMALMLAIFSLILQRFSSTERRFGVYAGLLLSLLLILHPYDFLIILAAGGVFSIWRIITANELNTLRNMLMMLVCAFPGLIIQAYTLAANPVLAEWAFFSAGAPSPPPWMYISGLGILVPLACIGAFKLIRERTDLDKMMFPIIWLTVVAVLVYAPVLFRVQRKLSEGVDIPLAILATLGVVASVSSLNNFNKKIGPIVLSLIFISGTIGTFQMLAVRIGEYRTQESRFYYSSNEDQAFEWINTHVPKESRILAGSTLGAVVPGRTGNSVYVGHFDNTPDYQEKIFLLHNAFTAHGKQHSRALNMLTKREHIDYALIDSELQTWNGDPFMPPENRNWEPVYENPAITLYKITD